MPLPSTSVLLSGSVARVIDKEEPFLNQAKFFFTITIITKVLHYLQRPASAGF